MAPGEKVKLIADATDPEGGPVAYLWSSLGGTFSDTAAGATTWFAPPIGAAPTISVVAMDSASNTAVARLTILVTPSPKAGPVDPNSVSVFYASNRHWAGGAYQNEAGALSYGMCDVSIPPGHSRGQIESGFATVIPVDALRALLRQDPMTEVIARSPLRVPKSEFVRRLRERLVVSKRREIFVFVHGFNVSFDDACKRTAQIATDIRFDGAPAMFSWPADGGRLNYSADRRDAMNSVPALLAFLSVLADESGATHLHVLAHSMGNRLLTETLIALAAAREKPIFDELIFAAPEVEPRTFERLVPLLGRVARHSTMYVSENDQALTHAPGEARIGLVAGGRVFIANGIDTVNVSPVDQNDFLGHSYYGSNKDVLIDLDELLIDKKRPPRRLITERFQGTDRYWQMRP